MGKVDKKYTLKSVVLSFLVSGMGLIYLRKFSEGIGYFIISVVLGSISYYLKSRGFMLASIAVWLVSLYETYRTSKSSKIKTPYKNAIWFTVIIYVFVITSIAYFWIGYYTSFNKLYPELKEANQTIENLRYWKDYYKSQMYYYQNLADYYQNQTEYYKSIVELPKDKIKLVEKLLQDYAKTHTYTYYDLFVCSDMAVEFWNILKTYGVNARIAIGNVENESATFLDYNHAWVLAEVEPFTWLACEVTGGYVVYADENPLYYKGIWFDNPIEFKNYVRTWDKLTETEIRIQTLTNEWLSCFEIAKTYTINDISDIGPAYEALGKCECYKDVLDTERENMRILTSQLLSYGQYFDLTKT